ncbi:hypothetical protein ACE6H2_023833 [Prunus campanulata]
MDMQSFDRREKHCIPILSEPFFFSIWFEKRDVQQLHILYIIYSRVQYNARLLCAPAMRPCGLQNIVHPWRVVASL